MSSRPRPEPSRRPTVVLVGPIVVLSGLCGAACVDPEPAAGTGDVRVERPGDGAGTAGDADTREAPVGDGADRVPRPPGGGDAAHPSRTPDGTPVHGYRVVASYPHDPGAFTQGLVYADGGLYESTGQYGSSSLRFVELETGRVQRVKRLNSQLFGEGLALVDRNLIQLTWRNGVALVHSADTFEGIGAFQYGHEGWGLAYDGTRLILSDGTPTLRFYDPYGFAPLGTLRVTDQGRPLTEINELEVVDGELWANLWHSDRIARIDLTTGEVTSYVDLEGLIDLEPELVAGERQNVLNGIAWDPVGRRLFVTGKNWPKLFQIEVVEGDE